MADKYSKSQIGKWNALLKDFRKYTKEFEKLVNEQKRALRGNKSGDPDFFAPSEKKANAMRTKLERLTNQVEEIPKDAFQFLKK